MFQCPIVVQHIQSAWAAIKDSASGTLTAAPKDPIPFTFGAVRPPAPTSAFTQSTSSTMEITSLVQRVPVPSIV